MSAARLDVLWSPSHVNQFLTFGTEISLYKADRITHGQVVTGSKALAQGLIRLSDDTTATLLSTNTDIQYMKCVAWYPKKEPEFLLAVGQANGRVVLTSFGQDGAHDQYGLIGKEFVPRHARQCNSLAWHPNESNMLAAGLDKYRSDSSVLVWDINAKYIADSANSPDKSRVHRDSVGSGEGPSMVSKPLVELGASETALSLAWFTHESKTLLVGMNNKFLKIFDLRDVSRPVNVALTKAVYGVAIDPHVDTRIASYVEGQVSIWDTRVFEKPVLTLTEQRHIAKIAWSPTRYGLLGISCKDSPVVRLYDIQHSGVGGDDYEPAIIERSVQPCGEESLSSFAWHPTHENRLMIITTKGNLTDLTVFERISLSWSPHSSITWACGKRLHHLTAHPTCTAEDDISIKMKRRARNGYGLQTDQISRNADMAPEDSDIRTLWHWLDYILSDMIVKTQWLEITLPLTPTLVRGLRDEGKIRTVGKGGFKYHGVKSVIKGETNMAGVCMKSDLHYGTLAAGVDKRTIVHTYRSEDRSRALQLCGWNFEKEFRALEDHLERLEGEGEYERAAAIALFNLKIRRAIQTLNKGATSAAHCEDAGDLNLNVVAMALSGYTDEKNTLWREMCGSLRTQLGHPYLRAMFAFLTEEAEGFQDVLNESGLFIQDRVAFACTFLPDARLVDYLEELTSEMVEKGNLEGILLTGLTTDGIDLLENYVNSTADVQTACLAMVQACPSDVSKDTRVQQWIESYRSLLDSWRFWHQRAQFDVHRNLIDPAVKPPQQVFVSCNFCGKSVSSNMLASGRTRGRPMGMRYGSPQKSKISSCPGCRKPLPRCALCLMNMGTASGTIAAKPNKEEKQDFTKEAKQNKFGSWFTWCQTCRHGGHANHMMEWFRDHTECPVTACHCKCMSLDSVGTVTTAEETTVK
ncbi:MIOS [Branchiostoma lanceolatum]|uniref:MIOS protein n=1 Tax=Branchiostoma lanceolatum TaxID=7740 RepID=A0A8J9YS24_BRALA|nr:MIOS [Branchiostoma lanceolatum]